MNTNNSSAKPVSNQQISEAALRAFQVQPDAWDALLSAFLVLCLFTAWVICGWQMSDWQAAHATQSAPVVVIDGDTHNA